MSDPVIVPDKALRGVRVAISVSESADLGRLGLTSDHCQLAVAELSRAVLLAGGDLVYGGRLKPAGFTQVLIDEALTFAEPRQALTLIVPYTEHRALTSEEMSTIDQRLGLTGQLVLLDPDGAPTSHTPGATAPADPASALSAMRRHVTERSDARVLVGGKLADYQGDIPGVIEEALLSLRAGAPLYVAGGFGGAAAAVARRLHHDEQHWAPADWPRGAGAAVIRQVLDEVEQLRGREADDGLDGQQRAQLASSHRPGEIASLVVLGLSRVHAGTGTGGEM
jgi:hypothetical protein